MFKKMIAGLLAFAAAAAFAAVDINKANLADLETVKGIGPAVATKILDERKKAPFKDWADVIDRVKGVGPGNAAKFSQGGLTVNGAGYAPSSLGAKPASATGARSANKDDKKDARK